MSSIFLSHSSQDNGIAGHVKVRLEQWGHRSVFLDFDPANGIPVGRDWEKELYAKLRECRALIILCSHASMASRWCFAEITHAKAMGKPVFPIKLDDAQVDRVLTSVQVIDATTGWDAACQRLEKGLLAAGLDPKNLFDWDTRRPPYPGLPAFQEQDAAIFFGRDKEIRDGQALLNRLQQFGGPRLTLMLGASGSGKSSLMRAGLLPRLKRDPRWVVVDPFRPLSAPFDELALVLSKRFSQVVEAEKRTPTNVARLRERIRWEEHQGEKSAALFLELITELRETAGARDATVLLMIDQCEELLAGGANEKGDRFLAFLRAVLDREDSCLMVLATLRSDFLGSFQEHPTMRGLRVEPFTVPQMAVDDFATVIEGPAGIASLELGPGLVQAMIGDTKTSDALPLLAFTLRELYEGFGEDKLLTLEDYRDKLGGLEGSIARTAEAVLKAKPLAEKEAADLRTALLSMVRVNDKDQYAKQPAQWNDLPVSSHDVLQRFVNARLLISSGDENKRTLEVAHEALFRAWPRLADWLRDNKSFLVWQQRLRASITHYEETKENPDLFLRGFSLTEALEWLKKKPDSFSAKERQFLRASKGRVARRRLLAVVIGGFVLSVIGALAWSWKEGVTVKYTVSIVKARLHLASVLEPEMVEIPGGDFLKGDKITRPNNPLLKVTVSGFMMGKYEVTFEQYDRYVELTGSRSPNDESLDRQRLPVTDVTWEDAVDYAKWLSNATGKRYRLPTDSEWEYAAGSGGKDTVWAGTSDENELKDYAVYAVPVRPKKVESVGSKKPNGFGLYDMSGNVW
jgi:formylglycine-generating enzyme required for sulfatase activity